jgi:CDP-diacylglycerol--serine O-phosphatidyltransferase
MRGTWVKEPKRRRAVYLIPNLLTTGNLFSGLFAILAVFKGHYVAAAVAILIALIFDMLDGKSARWMNSTSQFGVEYDSLADLVAFGVAPGLLMYGWAIGAYDMFGPAVMFTFVACGALRLARFNVMTATSESKYFTGLPIPAAASVVATLVIFDHHTGLVGIAGQPVPALVLTLVLAFLMVSTVKYRSFKDLKFSGRAHFDNLVLAILMLMLVIAWPQVMLFAVFACYAVSGPIEKGASLLLKPFGKRPSEQQAVLETKE